MSRAEYSDDLDQWMMIRWRGQVTSAIRGKRGQAFLRELLAVLDAMPEKKLVRGEFELEGAYCALGAVAKARGLPLEQFDPDDATRVGKHFNIANPLAREIMFENDEFIHWDPAIGRVREIDDEGRWRHMREWVAQRIVVAENELLPEKAQ